MVLSAYVPLDRRLAIKRGVELPQRAEGAALIADVSGFTHLAEVLVEELGTKRGAEELTRRMNAVYGALVDEVHYHGGSVVSFGGDAILCWLDGDDGTRAVSLGLAMQGAMRQFDAALPSGGVEVPLAIKVAVSTGPVRRMRVGDPHVQYLDMLAGAVIRRVHAAEKMAARNEVVVSAEVVERLGDVLNITEWRTDMKQRRYATVVAAMCRWENPAGWPSALRQLEVETLETDQVRPWLPPDVFERLHHGEDRFLAEVRPVVIMFVRFSGIDFDHDELAAMRLDQFARRAQAILAYYGGHLLHLADSDDGSYLHAVFGAPSSHGDDAARAMAAAYELRSLPAQLAFIDGVQIGISQGRVQAGAYGGPTCSTYGVLGTEVNVAARLMEAAEPNGILVSQRIVDATSYLYCFAYLGDLTVRGQLKAVPVSRVEGRRPPPSRSLPLVLTCPTVGRVDELLLIGQLLKTVQMGEWRVLRLEGGAGIGKSHLAAELVAMAANRNYQVTVGICQSTLQGVAYHPWRQIFRWLFDLEDEPLQPGEVTAWTQRQQAHVTATVGSMDGALLLRLPLLGDLLGLPMTDNGMAAAFDARERQEALFALVADLLQSLARARPVVIVLEDAHWLDEASEALTLSLARTVSHSALLLVLVQRTAEAPVLRDLSRLPAYRRVDLAELGPEAVGQLVSNRLHGTISGLALSLIQVQAQGNPFFSEEMVDVMVESGSLRQRADGVWDLSDAMFDALRRANCLVHATEEYALRPDAPLATVDIGLPDSVREIVLSRLDRLPEALKLTLKVASVIGYSFELALLAQAHPVDRSLQALREDLEMLVARDLVRPELPEPRTTYRFKHNITQEVTYNTLLEAQQRELHRRVAHALLRVAPIAVERLAYHFNMAGSRSEGLHYLQAAAEKARREYALETAINYYQQALDIELRWDWLKAQAEMLHLLGRRDEERVVLERLGGIPDAPLFEIAFLWGQYREAVGEFDAAQHEMRRGLALARERGDGMGEVACLAQLGLIARRQGDYQHAGVCYREALALFRQMENTLPDQEAQLLNGLGMVHLQQAEYGEARACYETALRLSRLGGHRIGEAQALNNMGLITFYQRNFAAASDYYRQALDIRRHIGDRAGEGATLANLAQAMRDGGDYGAALQCLTDALAIEQATGNRWAEVNAWNDLGILHLMVGDLLRAQSHLLQGLKLTSEINDESGWAYILCNLGQVMREAGDLDAADGYLAESLALAERQGDRNLASMCLSHLAAVRLNAGRPAQAIDLAETALAMRRDLNLHMLTTMDLTTLAQAHLASGRSAEAVELVHEALRLLEQSGGVGPEYPHHDYLHCYRVLAATGRSDEANAALRVAHELLTAQAQRITHPAMRESFRRGVSFNRQIDAEWAAAHPSDAEPC